MSGNRHLKCTCTNCACVFRMTRIWLKRALDRGGLRCPVCCRPAVEGEVHMSDDDRAHMERICASVAEAAAAELNAEELERREQELASRRVHIERRKRGVNTDGVGS